MDRPDANGLRDGLSIGDTSTALSSTSNCESAIGVAEDDPATPTVNSISDNVPSALSGEKIAGSNEGYRPTKQAKYTISSGIRNSRDDLTDTERNNNSSRGSTKATLSPFAASDSGNDDSNGTKETEQIVPSMTTAHGQMHKNPLLSYTDAVTAAKSEYNRRNAARARKRAKDRITDLQNEIRTLSQNIHTLRKTNSNLQTTLWSLKEQSNLLVCNQRAMDTSNHVTGPVSSIHEQLTQSLTPVVPPAGTQQQTTPQPSVNSGDALLAFFLVSLQNQPQIQQPESVALSVLPKSPSDETQQGFPFLPQYPANFSLPIMSSVLHQGQSPSSPPGFSFAPAYPVMPFPQPDSSHRTIAAPEVQTVSLHASISKGGRPNIAIATTTNTSTIDTPPHATDNDIRRDMDQNITQDQTSHTDR